MIADKADNEVTDTDRRRRGMVVLIAGLVALPLTGCITVKAPDRPIEINLNVKVQQEVVVRLQKDAQDLIENNPELFPG